MAQTVVVVDLLDEVGNLAYDFFTYIPSPEELEGIAEENELLGAISCQYIGYNIGEGESDMDEFFSSKEIKEILDSVKDISDFETAIEEKGYYISEYIRDRIEIVL